MLMGCSIYLLKKKQKIICRGSLPVACSVLLPLRYLITKEIKANGVLAYSHLGMNLYTITSKRFFMLKWAAIFFVIAIIAAIFGFTDIAAGAASIAKVLFFIFLV